MLPTLVALVDCDTVEHSSGAAWNLGMMEMDYHCNW